MAIALKNGRWLSALVVILSFSYIAYRVVQYHQQFSAADLPQLKTANILFTLLLQVILLFLNVILEAKKWQLLIGSVTKTGFTQALKMVLAGFSSGIITPAKLGEPIGRAMFLKKEFWIQTTLLTYLGGLISNIAVFMLAIPCVLVVYHLPWHNTPFLSLLFFTISAGVCVTLIFVWYKKDWVKKHIYRYKVGQRIKMVFHQIAVTPADVIMRVLAYSLFRILVYSFQLAIMLCLVGANITAHTLMLIPIYYLLVSLAPAFFLAELGIRGSVALFVFPALGLSAASILLAITTLWILNQMLPALTGIVLIWQINSKKSYNSHNPT